MSTTSCECDNCETTEGCDCFGEGVVIPTGPKGNNGSTAYQLWLDQGNTGTVADFLASLKGDKGDQGDQGIQGVAGAAATPLSWQDLTLVNGWTATVLPNQTPQYAIDGYGVIHFRGALEPAAKTDNVFADLSAVLTSNTRLHNGSAMNVNEDMSYFYITDAGLVASACATGFVLYLESASKFFVGD